MTRDRDAAEGRDANAARVPQDRQARAEGIALLEKLEQFLREEGMKESSDPVRAQRIKALWEEVREALK